MLFCDSWACFLLASCRDYQEPPRQAVEEKVPLQFHMPCCICADIVKKKSVILGFSTTFLGRKQIKYLDRKPRFPTFYYHKNSMCRNCIFIIFTCYWGSNQYLIINTVLQLPNSSLACLKPLKRLSLPQGNRFLWLKHNNVFSPYFFFRL